MALDRQFWLEALNDIHGLTLAPNTDYDWRSWAQGVLREAAGDEDTFENIRNELAPPDRWSEELCLDRLFHLLKAREIEADDAFQMKAFFLLCRLVERRP